MAQKRIKVKPGKTQSKLGFGVGIIFVLIGGGVSFAVKSTSVLCFIDYDFMGSHAFLGESIFIMGICNKSGYGSPKDTERTKGWDDDYTTDKDKYNTYTKA